MGLLLFHLGILGWEETLNLKEVVEVLEIWGGGGGRSCNHPIYGGR